MTFKDQYCIEALSRPRFFLQKIEYFHKLSRMSGNLPHRGLPPWRVGGAYAPMTQTIF